MRWIKIRISPDGYKFGITNVVLSKVADATSTVLPTAWQLPVSTQLATIRPGDIIDFLMRLALAIEPALDDLDSIEIGANRITQRIHHEGWALLLLLGAGQRSAPIGTPFSYPRKARLPTVDVGVGVDSSHRRSARRCGDRWSHRFPCDPSHRRVEARVFSFAQTAV